MPPVNPPPGLQMITSFFGRATPTPASAPPPEAPVAPVPAPTPTTLSPPAPPSAPAASACGSSGESGGPLSRRKSQRVARRQSMGPYSASRTGLTSYMQGAAISFGEEDEEAQEHKEETHAMDISGEVPQASISSSSGDGDEMVTAAAPTVVPFLFGKALASIASASSAATPQTAGVETNRLRSKVRRVGFAPVVTRILIDAAGIGRLCGEANCLGCALCEVNAQTRPSDRGRYYPEASTRSEQKQHRELPKRPEGERDASAARWWNAFDSMCQCSRGKCNARCPCVANGVGCWWEKNEDIFDGRPRDLSWGCGCKGRCDSSGRASYLCDLPAVREERRVRLQELGIHTTGGTDGHVAPSGAGAGTISMAV